MSEVYNVAVNKYGAKCYEGETEPMAKTEYENVLREMGLDIGETVNYIFSHKPTTDDEAKCKALYAEKYMNL